MAYKAENSSRGKRAIGVANEEFRRKSDDITAPVTNSITDNKRVSSD